MSPPGLSLIRSSSSTLSALSPFPPKHLHSKRNVTSQHRLQHLDVSRRNFALISFLSLMPSLSWPSHASAFSIGISGPKDWLKEQKKKASNFLLAPIDASRESLQSVYLLLSESGYDYTDNDLEKVQTLLRSAARDCVPQERNSFVAFQANTGVEVCTFRLIAKNASSLLGDKDPVKLKAEAMLDDLIRSFTSVSGLANGSNIQLASNRKKIVDAVMDTVSSLNKFEQGIKDCLEI
ncbi:Plasma membrane fusion protein [Quillaja saponaria]|uniref:Plasma membrane fusion protein n=1 Tax=Quillaja saponaria TaxID=32244 RepID=A0AAD7M085_QUISA|nr:Plasma membrane fusion protein [Quillaja saponaria]